MTLQKWLIRYWVAMLAFLVIVYFLMQFFMLHVLTERIEHYVHSNVAITENSIEDSLGIIDSFINESLGSGSYEATWEMYETMAKSNDPLELGYAKAAVSNSLVNLVTWTDLIDYIMIYTDRADGGFWLETGKERAYRQRSETREYVSRRIQAGEFDELSRYMICHTSGGNHMVRVLKIESSYVFIGVSEREILKTLSYAAYDENSIAFAASLEGDIIFASRKRLDRVDPAREGSYIQIDGQDYLQTGYVSDTTGYYFGLLTAKSSISSDMWVYRISFAIVFLVLIILIPFFFLMMRKYIQRPIEEVSASMYRISEGDLDTSIEKRYFFSELNQLVLAFNHMIDKVRQLKIEKYEVKLEAQKASMQYLQLQVRPHFYANVLNIIYSLAERKDYETIQKVSKAIVRYSRYMFRDANELVELDRELEHVSDYMEIQDVRYMQQISFVINAPEEIRSALVPPFIIQSFVENSVKYAFTTRKNSMITINVSKTADNANLVIEIRDNGQGYSEDLLCRNWDNINEDGHVGLSNVYKRLKLIFEDKANIKLYNDDGAVSLIMIPYIAVDEIDIDEDMI